MEIKTKYRYAIVNVSLQLILALGAVIMAIINRDPYAGMGEWGLLCIYQFFANILGTMWGNNWRVGFLLVWIFGYLMGGGVLALIALTMEVLQEETVNSLAGAGLIILPVVYVIYSIRELVYFHLHPDKGGKPMDDNILDMGEF